jgi:hypothetical protein
MEPQHRKLLSVEALTERQRRDHRCKRIVLFVVVILVLTLLGLGVWELWSYQPSD